MCDLWLFYARGNQKCCLHHFHHVCSCRVIPAPGGVGAIEFLFTLFFTKLVGQVKAVSGAIIFRVATYFIPAIWGFIVFWGLKTKQIRGDRTEISFYNQL